MVTPFRTFQRGLPAVAAAAVISLSAVAAADVRMEISPRRGPSNEQFTLSIVVDSTEEVSTPTLSRADDFNVQFIGPQSSVSIINGKVSKRLAFNYRLIPRKEGKLLTPSAELEVGGVAKSLKAIPVEVTPPSTPAAETISGLRLHQSIDPKELYVGQQAALTIELETAVNLIDPQFVDLTYDGFWTETIAENERSSKIVRGDQYDVVRFRKALYPLRAGSISIPPRRLKTKVRHYKRNRAFPFDNFDPFDVDVFDRFFGRGDLKEVAVDSNPLVVEVRSLPPIPKGFPLWGLTSPIVGETTLTVSVPEGKMRVGDTKTVEIAVVTTGSLSALKGAEIRAPSGIKVYEDAPETQNFESGGVLMSRKIFRLSLVPLHGGELRIPPLELGYFDTIEKQYRIARSQEILLDVDGPPQPKAATATASPLVSPAVSESPESPILAYREEGMLERVSSSISFSLAALVLAACFVIFLLLRFMTRAAGASAPRRQSLKRIERADTLEELNRAFRSFLALELGQGEQEELGTEQLRALLSRTAASKEVLFQLHAVLDEMDAALYAPGAKSDFPALRQKVLSAARLYERPAR